jgi:hypothetical protein
MNLKIFQKMAPIRSHCSKKIIIYLTCIFYPIIGLNAQGLKKNGYYIVPEVFNSYCKPDIINEIENGNKSIKDLKQIVQGRIWEVYSDRELNKYFINASLGNSSGKTFKFMEPLVIEDVVGTSVKVYSMIDKVGGWISVKNLILNGYSLLNQNSIPKKAMALVSLDNAKDELAKDDIEKYKLYYGPNTQKIKGAANKFEIYYVLKEVEGKKLLSRVDKLSGSQVALDVSVAGWMANFHITNWDSRLCLEISSKISAQTEYKDYEIPVFPTVAKLETFMDEGITNTDGAIMRNSIRTTVPDPYVMRMPILDNIDDGMKKRVATIGSLEKSTDQTEVAGLMRKLQEAKNKLENVNMVFIIDGTASMTQYYKAVANSLKKIIQNNELLRTNNKLRFGLVIYRDYADGKSAVEVERLTANYETILDKILTTICFSADKDLPEAQYNGIISGIQKVGFNKDQSNIVVLIGDAGNHNPDPEGKTLEQVCKVLKDYEASLIAFQVVNGRDQSYTDFNFDAQDMLLKTGALYTNSSQNVKLLAINLKNSYKLNFTSMNNSSKEVPDLFMFGSFTYATGSQAMSTNILEENIVSTTREYLDWVENIKSLCEGVKTGNTDKYSEDIIKYLKEKLGLTDSDIQKLKKIKEFSFIGFTSAKFYNKDADCYLPVVFLSKTELDLLVESFQDFRFGVQSVEDKKNNLKKALIQQTMKMLGEINEDNIVNKSMNEIWEIILAIPFDRKGKYGKLSTVKLRDLNKVSEKEFENFINDFEIKIKGFKIDSFNKYQFQTGNQWFYWVPLSSFPGND